MPARLCNGLALGRKCADGIVGCLSSADGATTGQLTVEASESHEGQISAGAGALHSRLAGATQLSHECFVGKACRSLSIVLSKGHGGVYLVAVLGSPNTIIRLHASRSEGRFDPGISVLWSFWFRRFPIEVDSRKRCTRTRWQLHYLVSTRTFLCGLDDLQRGERLGGIDRKWAVPVQRSSQASVKHLI